MMISSSHHTREQFEHCLAAIRQASVEILLLLNVHVSEGKDPRWFLEQLDSARLGLARLVWHPPGIVGQKGLL
ncbi:STY4199 family HEPN domain-containing protein, partial [Enterobacter hormaechei]|uniref:STY4199 family HEPN domain-containing protein n=1 Tax=Enterobacter hormaechei TaxID=158836 RepID=UPI0023F9B53F